MTKHELISAFCKNHQQFVEYVNSLTEDEFMYSQSGKWTAGQQLQHVYLCLLPFTKLLPSKEFILQKFGKINRPTWDYGTAVANYLKTTLQASDRFIPEQVSTNQKDKISEDIQEVVTRIGQLLDEYTDEELDTFAMPHPLIGNLTIREMFYLMTYHAPHHFEQIQRNLRS